MHGRRRERWAEDGGQGRLETLVERRGAPMTHWQIWTVRGSPWRALPHGDPRAIGRHDRYRADCRHARRWMRRRSFHAIIPSLVFNNNDCSRSGGTVGARRRPTRSLHLRRYVRSRSINITALPDGENRGGFLQVQGLRSEIFLLEIQSYFE